MKPTKWGTELLNRVDSMNYPQRQGNDHCLELDKDTIFVYTQ